MSNVKQFKRGLVLTPVSSDPASPVQGQYQESDGTARSAGLWRYDGTSWVEAGGSGGGGLDVFHTETFENNGASTFTQGNNAAPDAAGTGTIIGTLSDDASTQISGLKSLKYVQGATSINDFFIVDTDISVDVKQVANDVGVSFYYKYDGNDGDIKFVVLDQDDAVLSSSLDLLDATTTATRFTTSFYIPTGTTAIRYGFQVVTTNDTQILIADDIELSLNPFVYKNLTATHSFEFTNNASAMTTTAVGAGRWGTLLEGGDSTLLSYDDSNGKFTALKTCTVNAHAGFIATGGSTSYILKNGTSVTNTNQIDQKSFAAGNFMSVSGDFELLEGDFFITYHNGTLDSANPQALTVVATATTEHVVTPAKSGSEVIEYTGFTSYSGGVKYKTERINTGSSLISVDNTTNTRITFEEESLFTAIASNSMTGSADGYIRMLLYNSSNVVLKSTYFDTNATAEFSSPAPMTGRANKGDYIIVQCPSNVADSTETNFSVLAHPLEATFLAVIPVQKVAYLKDVKSNGTAGGTFTASSWQTRTLNTVEGDTSIVSLSTNQFTLGAGKYKIDAQAPVRGTQNAHKAKIYDITNSADILIGINARTGTNDDGDNAFVKGPITITTTTTFELQHYASTTRSTDGFGVACSFSVDEVYSIVKITKLR